MFNFSGSEIIFLLLAGLVVLGPERLPGVIRRAGRTYGQLRRATQGIEREFRETFKEPIDEFTSAADSMKYGFGLVDNEPSPPMRPEMAEIPKPDFSPTSAQEPDVPVIKTENDPQ